MEAYASETDVNSNLTLLFLHEEVDGVCNFSTNSVCFHISSLKITSRQMFTTINLNKYRHIKSNFHCIGSINLCWNWLKKKIWCCERWPTEIAQHLKIKLQWHLDSVELIYGDIHVESLALPLSDIYFPEISMNLKIICDVTSSFSSKRTFRKAPSW